jgi:hypothetical protein
MQNDLAEDTLLAAGFWVKNNPTNQERRNIKFFAKLVCQAEELPYDRMSVPLIALRRMHNPIYLSTKVGTRPYLILPNNYNRHVTTIVDMIIGASQGSSFISDSDNKALTVHQAQTQNNSNNNDNLWGGGWDIVPDDINIVGLDIGKWF